MGLNRAGLSVAQYVSDKNPEFYRLSIDPRLLDGWQTVADYLLSLFTYFSNYASRFIQPAFPWPRKEREWPHIYSLGHGHLGVCLS